MQQLSRSKASLEHLDAETIARLLSAAADITLVLDRDGVIRDLAYDPADLRDEGLDAWLGKAWPETVTADSRPKVEALLAAAVADTPPRWRHVNFPTPGDHADLPVLCAAVDLAPKRGVVVFGRDLRGVAALQQQLVDAQQAMERDYVRLRTIETRYRLVFQTSSDPILIVDARTRRPIEVNAAAARLFGLSQERLLARRFVDGFAESSREAVDDLLSEAQTSGGTRTGAARLAHGEREVQVTASQLRQDGTALLVIRVSPEIEGAVAAPTTTERLLDVVERAPDAFVITDQNGRVLWINRAFADLAQLPSGSQAEGQPLDRWLGQPTTDLGVILGNLRHHGSLRLLPSSLRSEHGVVAKVEVSAVAVPDGRPRWFGFMIRDVGRRLGMEPRSPRQLPRSVEQLTELVGQVPLKELVRETTDIIERLCIEAALELTADNRASAAEMLGLSRQSLYVKLRRYGLGDLTADA